MTPQGKSWGEQSGGRRKGESILEKINLKSLLYSSVIGIIGGVVSTQFWIFTYNSYFIYLIFHIHQSFGNTGCLFCKNADIASTVSFVINIELFIRALYSKLSSILRRNCLFVTSLIVYIPTGLFEAISSAFLITYFYNYSLVPTTLVTNPICFAYSALRNLAV